MRMFGIGHKNWIGLSSAESINSKAAPVFQQDVSVRGINATIQPLKGTIQWTAFGSVQQVRALVVGDCFLFAFQASGSFIGDDRWRQDRILVSVDGPSGKRMVTCRGYWNGPQRGRCVAIPEALFLAMSAFPGGYVIAALNTLCSGMPLPGLIGLAGRLSNGQGITSQPRVNSNSPSPSGIDGAGGKLLSVCRAVPWAYRAVSPSPDTNVLISKLEA